MAKETTTKDMGRGKKVDQKYVNHIEKGLSQPGGIMITELAADLALKFGRWNTELDKALDADEALQEDVAQKRLVDEDRIKAKRLKIREERRKAEELRRTENQSYKEIVLQYIKEVYKEERREILNEPNSRLVGYGDRIEIDKKAHLHKIW